MHRVQLCGDKLHHHALNDPSQDQLSAVAVLSVRCPILALGDYGQMIELSVDQLRRLAEVVLSDEFRLITGL
jgi:hypothetical protein